MKLHHFCALFQELKDQAPRDMSARASRSYLWEDVFGMVSFQKSLVRNIYITPIWFNGIFVEPKEKGNTLISVIMIKRKTHFKLKLYHNGS